MGYFSNGTQGMDYQEQYCVRCLNDGPEGGPGCPILGIHLVWNYKLCNDDPKESPGKAMLDSFIPMTEDGLHNLECKMFLRVPEPTIQLETWQQPGRWNPAEAGS